MSIVATSSVYHSNGIGVVDAWPDLSQISPSKRFAPRKDARRPSTESRRTRSQTQSSNGTTRPSTSTDRSFSASSTSTSLLKSAPTSPLICTDEPIFYTMPLSRSATDLSSPETSSSAEPVSGWKTVVRKASGRFRRSLSSNSLPAEASALHTSPKKERSRSGSNHESPVTPTSPSVSEFGASQNNHPGILNGLLTRKKSSNSLKAEKKRQDKWQDLPPSPMPSRSVSEGAPHLEKKSTFRIGKGKQRLDQVQISPFLIDLDSTPSDNSPPNTQQSTLQIPVTKHTFRRSSSESSFRDLQQQTSRTLLMPRSVSSNSGLERDVHPSRSLLVHSDRSPSLLSSSPSNSSLDEHYPHHSNLNAQSQSRQSSVPPVPPLPDNLIFQPTIKEPVFDSNTTTDISDLGLPPTQPLRLKSSQSSNHVNQPVADRARPAQSETRVKFPSLFNFVPRPEDEDAEFGSSASATDVIPLLPNKKAPPSKPVIKPPRRNPLRLVISPEQQAQLDLNSEEGYVPPRRSESLARPIPSISSKRRDRSATKAVDKMKAFEDMLSSPSSETLKLSLSAI